MLLLTVGGAALFAGRPVPAQELPNVTVEGLMQTLSNPERLEDMFIAVGSLRLNLAIADQTPDRSVAQLVQNGFPSFAQLRDRIRSQAKFISDSIAAATADALDLGEAATAAVRAIARRLTAAGLTAGSTIFNYLILKYQEFLIAAKTIGEDINSWMCQTQPFDYYCRR